MLGRLMRKYGSFLLILLGLGYFVFHTIQGERGLLSLFRKQKELEISRTLLKRLQEKKDFMERRVRLLGKEIDLDMLEERVRAQLNYVLPEEKVIFEE